jgi:protein-tyrosine phosphatase
MKQIIDSSLQLLKKPFIFKTYNSIFGIEKANSIVPHLFLGNIESSRNEVFLQNEYIQSVVNCTENEIFHSQFSKKNTYRIPVKDSKDIENMRKLYQHLHPSVLFIDKQIQKEKNVLVHCYWGFMRSATVVGAYLIYKYKMKPNEAIYYIKERRPHTFNAMYNYGDLLNEYYREHISQRIEE